MIESSLDWYTVCTIQFFLSTPPRCTYSTVQYIQPSPSTRWERKRWERGGEGLHTRSKTGSFPFCHSEIPQPRLVIDGWVFEFVHRWNDVLQKKSLLIDLRIKSGKGRAFKHGLETQVLYSKYEISECKGFPNKSRGGGDVGLDYPLFHPTLTENLIVNEWETKREWKERKCMYGTYIKHFRLTRSNHQDGDENETWRFHRLCETHWNDQLLYKRIVCWIGKRIKTVMHIKHQCR